MQYRNLGCSGLKVSAIGLGTGSPTFVGRSSDAEAISIVRQALEMGFHSIDTAETYAEGRAESLLGEALKGHRD